MQSKLVAMGAGVFGFGALLSWAITADHYENKMKSNQKILLQLLRRQNQEILDLTRAQFLPPMAVDPSIEPISWDEIDDEAVKNAAALQKERLSSDEDSDESVEIVAAIDPSVVDVETVEVEAPAQTEAELEAEEVSDAIIEERRTNLQKLIDSYTSDPDTRDEFVAKAARSIAHQDLPPPYVISRETYAHDPDGDGDSYAKITLFYHQKDRVLIDDDEDLIEDIDGYVGWRSLNQFGGESGDPDTVFVRNDRLLTDFEVVREEGDPPIHIRYGMSREEFRSNKAAGNIKFRDEDRD